MKFTITWLYLHEWIMVFAIITRCTMIVSKLKSSDFVWPIEIILFKYIGWRQTPEIEIPWTTTTLVYILFIQYIIVLYWIFINRDKNFRKSRFFKRTYEKQIFFSEKYRKFGCIYNFPKKMIFWINILFS